MSAPRPCGAVGPLRTFAIWAAIFMKMNDWMTIKVCSLPYIQLPHANRKLSLWQHKMFLKTHEHLSVLYWQCSIDLPHCNYVFAFCQCPRARYQWTLGYPLGNKAIKICSCYWTCLSKVLYWAMQYDQNRCKCYSRSCFALITSLHKPIRQANCPI